MFKLRIISFPLLLALLALIVFWREGGPWVYTAVAALMTAGVCFETAKMTGLMGLRNFPGSAAVLGGLFFLIFNLVFNFAWLNLPPAAWLSWLLPGEIILLIAAGWGGLLFCREKKRFWEGYLNLLGTLFLVLIPMMFLTMVYWSCGIALFAAVVLITKAMDTGGYIFGMLSAKLLPGGNHKILPKISPKKSWEGTVGGLLFSTGTALLFWRFGNFEEQSPVWWLAAGIVLGLGSFAGDLTESALKRTAGIKDSGNIIPGMGGVFDVLDSFIYNGILFWLLCWATGSSFMMN